MRPRARAILAALTIALAGCAQPPTGPCLGEAAETVTVPHERLEVVSHEAEGDVELVRFAFDPEAAGEATVTVEAATGPFIEAAFGDPIPVIQGERLTSIRIDGLVGGASTDRIRTDALDPYRIREVVQVRDPDAFRWIVGTSGASCLRLRAGEGAATVSLIVTAE